MQIHIDTTTDGPDEYRAARAALNELLGEAQRPVNNLYAGASDYGRTLPTVLDDPEVKQMVDDFRTVVQAEDDAEAAAAFGIPPASPQVQAMVDELAAGLQPVVDPAAQYQALGGTLPPAYQALADKIPPDVDKHGKRGKRGVSSDIVSAVTAELKARAGLPAVAAPAVAPPMAPPAPPPVTQTPPPPPSGPTFMDVTAANMAAIGAGKWTAAQAVALAQTLGLESIAGLQGRPDLIPAYLASVPAATQ